MLQTMAQSQQQLQEDLLSMKTQLLSGQEDTAERVAKRLRREKAFDFKRKGNKRQFEFNESVVDKIEEATSAVGLCTAASSSGKNTTPTLQRAKEALEKGLKRLSRRQKLIKIADRSEYEDDELAADSDDEKRLAKAEKAAEKKVSKRKLAVKQRRQRWMQPTQTRGVTGGGQQAATQQLQSQPKPPYLPVSRQISPCFSCGRYGHLRRNCGVAVRADAAGGRPTTYPLDSSQFSLQLPVLSTSTSVDTVVAGARVDMQGTSPPGGGEAGNVHDMYLVAGCQSRDWSQSRQGTRLIPCKVA